MKLVDCVTGRGLREHYGQADTKKKMKIEYWRMNIEPICVAHLLVVSCQFEVGCK